MFNTFVETSTTIGGGVPVWQEINETLPSGASLGILPAVGTVLPAGTPIAVSSAGGTGYPIYFAVAATGDATGSTKLVINAGDNYAVPVVGDKITVIDGQELTISVVGEASEGAIALTVTELTADIAAGAVLYLSERDSKDISLANLAGLLGKDVYGQTGQTYATLQVVLGGTVYADRVPFVPFEVRNRIPKISFVGGI